MGKQSIIVFNNIESGDLHSAGIILRAISHPLRLKILAFIDKNKPVNVHNIYTTLNLDQSIASQQLNILRSSNLVKTSRDGKFIYYTLNYENILRINNLIEQFKR